MYDFIITADGGSLGNGTKGSTGYGSFIVEHADSYRISQIKPKQFRHTFGAGITNNEAEYMIVIEALKLIQSVLKASGESVINSSILIKSDSALVIGQCSSGWKIKADNLRPLNIGVMNLINKFGNVEFEKISGDKMKSILGH